MQESVLPSQVVGPKLQVSFLVFPPQLPRNLLSGLKGCGFLPQGPCGALTVSQVGGQAVTLSLCVSFISLPAAAEAVACTAASVGALHSTCFVCRQRAGLRCCWRLRLATHLETKAGDTFRRISTHNRREIKMHWVSAISGSPLPALLRDI